ADNPRGGAMPPPPAGGGAPVVPNPSANPAGGTDAPGVIRSKPRYEFVIMLMWREPTPSDKLVPTAPQ
ncbi:MAG: hypothetical protein K1X57_22375, partial [Gemmataceae bacterium]|nr:hypothetical protein [Gemmataceae bacterium]